MRFVIREAKLRFLWTGASDKRDMSIVVEATTREMTAKRPHNWAIKILLLEGMIRFSYKVKCAYHGKFIHSFVTCNVVFIKPSVLKFIISMTKVI